MAKRKAEVVEGGDSVVVSPTTPTPNTPGDDNPVFAIPRTEVSGDTHLYPHTQTHSYIACCEYEWHDNSVYSQMHGQDYTIAH